MKKMTQILVLLLAGIFCFCGLAFGDSVFGPDPIDYDCTCVRSLFEAGYLPAPDKGHKGGNLRGTFTVSRDNPIPNNVNNYIVHITLKKGKEVHLFFFEWPYEGCSKPFDCYDLCAADASTLKDWFVTMACDLDVEKPFGMEGKTPLIKRLKITHRDRCREDDMAVVDPPIGWTLWGAKEMIRGKLVIDFVDTQALLELCE